MHVDTIERVRVRVLPDGRLTRADAAAFLGLSPKTLAEWKSKGTGPMSLRIGGRCFYRLSDLEAFRDTGARIAA
jgi:hypothetical protein